MCHSLDSRQQLLLCDVIRELIGATINTEKITLEVKTVQSLTCGKAEGHGHVSQLTSLPPRTWRISSYNTRPALLHAGPWRWRRRGWKWASEQLPAASQGAKGWHTDRAAITSRGSAAAEHQSGPHPTPRCRCWKLQGRGGSNVAHSSTGTWLGLAGPRGWQWLPPGGLRLTQAYLQSLLLGNKEVAVEGRQYGANNSGKTTHG